MHFLETLQGLQCVVYLYGCVTGPMQGQGKDIYNSLLGDLREPVESNEFRLKLKVWLFPPPLHQVARPKRVGVVLGPGVCLLLPADQAARHIPSAAQQRHASR